MLENYAYSFRAVLKFEGGFSNDAHDPGGATNLGIIQKEYNSYRDRKGLNQQSVRLITQNEANEIYKIQYWDALRLDDFPAGIDFVIFDAAVNNGVGAAPKFAQRACNKVSGSNLDVDGHLGLISREAIFSCPPASFIDAFCDERLRYDRSLKIWRYFGSGWTKRVNGDPRTGYQGVRGIAKALALKDKGLVPPLAPPQLISRETISYPTAWDGGIISIFNWIMIKIGIKRNAS
jgi:lysozyme family protein